MLKDLWSDIGRFESLFLEILDDTSKKEVLLYPICYCQIVRREGGFEVKLPKLLSCAGKTFSSKRYRWQDILLELDMFMLIGPSDEVIVGKDILSVQDPEAYRISFLPEYREIFYDVYSTLLKYWSVLSKVSGCSRRNTPAESVFTASLIFNEELFQECAHFCKNQSLRFKEEEAFFSALEKLSNFYSGYGDTKDIVQALESLYDLPDNFYSVDLEALREEINLLLKEIRKGKVPFKIKIKSVSGPDHGQGLFRRLLSKLVEKIKGLGGRRWTLMSSETAYFSFTEISLRRQKNPPIPS